MDDMQQQQQSLQLLKQRILSAFNQAVRQQQQAVAKKNSALVLPGSLPATVDSSSSRVEDIDDGEKIWTDFVEVDDERNRRILECFISGKPFVDEDDDAAATLPQKELWLTVQPKAKEVTVRENFEGSVQAIVEKLGALPEEIGAIEDEHVLKEQQAARAKVEQEKAANAKGKKYTAKASKKAAAKNRRGSTKSREEKAASTTKVGAADQPSGRTYVVQLERKEMQMRQTLQFVPAAATTTTTTAHSPASNFLLILLRNETGRATTVDIVSDAVANMPYMRSICTSVTNENTILRSSSLWLRSIGTSILYQKSSSNSGVARTSERMSSIAGETVEEKSTLYEEDDSELKNADRLAEDQQKTTNQSDASNTPSKPHKPSLSASFLSELENTVQKFANSLADTDVVLQKGNRLEFPERLGDILPLSSEDLAGDREIMNFMNDLSQCWVGQINRLLDAQTTKTPRNPGPQAELDFWRDRFHSLSAIHEQLQSKIFCKVLDVLHCGSSREEEPLANARRGVQRLFIESKDNCRFLSTIERQIKNIIFSEQFSLASVAIRAILDGLRMIWTISRYYNTDEKMLPLLSRIAWELCEKVSRELNVRLMFQTLSADELQLRFAEARKMMECWKSSYLRVRAEIERHGRDARWEFDRRKLFEKTDYISHVSTELMDIAETLSDFRIFGPELKSITGDTKKVGQILQRVENLIIPIISQNSSSFGSNGLYPFDPEMNIKWRQYMDWFRRERTNIETESRQFINHSFQALRSPDAALHLLANIRKIRTRKSIKRELLQQTQNVLMQFKTRIEEIEFEFLSRKQNPPPILSFSTYPGNIRWSRLLFLNIRTTIDNFHEHESSVSGDLNQQLNTRYLSLARAVKEYEVQQFEDWAKLCGNRLNKTLKASVLKILRQIKVVVITSEKSATPPTTLTAAIAAASKLERYRDFGTVAGGSGDAQGSAPATSDSAVSLPMFKTLNIILYIAEDKLKVMMSDANLRLKHFADLYQLEVDFDGHLLETAQEAKDFENIGLQVPEHVRSVALQEDRFFVNIENLSELSAKFARILDRVNAQEILLIARYIGDVNKLFLAGTKRWNWNSLGLRDFFARCNASLQNLEQIHVMVRKCFADCHKITRSISKVNVMRTICNTQQHSTATTGAMSRQRPNVEFVKPFQHLTNIIADQMSRKYSTIPTNLLKLEGNLFQTSTQTSPTMQESYQYWCEQMVKAIVVSSLRSYATEFVAIKGSSTQQQPVFTIDIQCRGGGGGGGGTSSGTYPQIVTNPEPSDFIMILLDIIRSPIAIASKYARWRNSTCIEIKSDPFRDMSSSSNFGGGGGGDNKSGSSTLSFGHDVCRSFAVVFQAKLITQLVAKTALHIAAFVKMLKSSFGFALQIDAARVANATLHSQKKNAEISTTDQPGTYSSGSDPPTIDEHLTRLEHITEAILKFPDEFRTGGFRLRVMQLKSALVTCVGEWRQRYVLDVRSEAHALASQVALFLREFFRHITDEPTDFVQLKQVLVGITEIRQEFRKFVSKISLIEQIYTVLADHGVRFARSEMSAIFSLRAQFAIAVQMALAREKDLMKTKKLFGQRKILEISQFRQTLHDLYEHYIINGAFNLPNQPLGEVIQPLSEELSQKVKELRANLEDFALSEKLLGLPLANFPLFDDLQEKSSALELILQIYQQFQLSRAQWSSTLWIQLDMNDIVTQVDAYLKRVKSLPLKFKKLACAQTLDAELKAFRQSLQIISELTGDFLRDRHWQELMKITSYAFELNYQSFTLSHLFAMQLSKFDTEVRNVLINAHREQSIEKAMRDVESTWKAAELKVITYLKGTEERGLIIGAVDEIQLLIEDQQTTLQGISGSRFAGPFLADVQKWEKSLSLISECLEIWMQVQRRWLWLEGVFTGADIRAQLPQESAKFDDCNKRFQTIMRDAFENSKVLHATHVVGRVEELQQLSNWLEECQKCLSDYLDTKRGIFARFYFISDEELLSIIGTTDPHAVQGHISKMFDNLVSLQIEEDWKTSSNVITGVNSAENEQLVFRTIVSTTGSVELWMNATLNEIRRTSWRISKEAVFAFCAGTKPRVEWMRDFQGMMCIAANQIWWTWEVEDAFRRIALGQMSAMKNYSQKMQETIKEVINKIRGQLSPNERKKLNTQLIIDVHNRDVIENFVRQNVRDPGEFSWESQIRFYWSRDDDGIFVRQCTNTLPYGYEYMGLNGRLVITPLTDRIYLTLTQALYFNLGGAPVGPAGTGKTETVKDLAKAVAYLCLVTNCGEGMDYKSVGKILAGLSQSGAWGCFDEFNRIDISVLSVVSTQLQTLFYALAHKQNRVLFEGVEINLDLKIGIFITMNPGYAGRTELPESIKALFRPVVCAVPDLQLICEIMLFSEGFFEAKRLALKITSLYQLCKEQLSKQSHYDFGLRAIKTVLITAGTLKRNLGDWKEEIVLVKALKDNNLPRFVRDDLVLFRGLMGDLFPGIDMKQKQESMEIFSEKIRDTLIDMKYEPVAEQIEKIEQLDKTLSARHSVMLVGATTGGKTVMLDVLSKVYSKTALPIRFFTQNPKAYSVNELYGVLDPNTRDWQDGIISKIYREMNVSAQQQQVQVKERRAIVFDGDVDALWIENMNSVMDDNKILTLANGERIRLQQNNYLLFEVGDLNYASPATVSRCGMVYVDYKTNVPRSLWNRWCRVRGVDVDSHPLQALYKKYVDQILMYVCGDPTDDVVGKSEVQTAVDIMPVHYMQQLLHMVDAIILPDADPTDRTAADKLRESVAPEQQSELLEAQFIMCLLWSFGAVLTRTSRPKFDAFLKKLSNFQPFDDSKQNRTPLNRMPSAEPTLYDYTIQISENKKVPAGWIPWKRIIPPYIARANQPFSEILVPTIDTERQKWLLNLLATRGLSPVLIVGDSGTSKSATINDFLRSLDREEWLTTRLNFSSFTTSGDVQTSLEANLEKRTKDMYGPPARKKMIFSIDDLNMPQLDEYGTQKPLAFLKFLLEKSAFYDRQKTLALKRVTDIGYVAAMVTNGGGVKKIDPRFVSLFSVFNITKASDDSLCHIYSSLFGAHVERHFGHVQGLREIVLPITDASLELYTTACQMLPPTPTKFQYTFNLRDASKVFQGLCLSSKESVQNAGDLWRLWRNESIRVYCDRMAAVEDQQFVRQTVQGLIERYAQASDLDRILREPLIFGDFASSASDDASSNQPPYQDLVNYEDRKSVV